MGKVELKIEIDPEVLRKAQATGVDVTAVVEAALGQAASDRTAAAEERARQWATENAEAIASHNRFVEENGAFGAEWRSW